jgi:hypothetical protein
VLERPPVSPTRDAGGPAVAWHDRVRTTRSIWVLIAIVYVYLALFALVVLLSILD